MWRLVVLDAIPCFHHAAHKRIPSAVCVTAHREPAGLATIIGLLAAPTSVDNQQTRFLIHAVELLPSLALFVPGFFLLVCLHAD